MKKKRLSLLGRIQRLERLVGVFIAMNAAQQFGWGQRPDLASKYVATLNRIMEELLNEMNRILGDTHGLTH